jgi:ABC-type nitrate/sulfonate/bicarbonate transport system substrate-binding protein
LARRLRVANSHYHVAHLLAPWIGNEWGYFEEEGVGEVDIISGGLVPASVERLGLAIACHEKGIDIVVDAKPPAIYYANNQKKDWYIVGCWRSQMPFKFFAVPEITSLEGLVGRKIARRDVGCISSSALSVQLIAAGIDPAKDVQWVSGYPTVPHQAADALLEGKVECAPVPANYAPRIKERGYVELLDMMKIYSQGRPDRIIAASRAIIEEDPDRVRGFLRGMIRGFWMIRNSKYLTYVAALDQRLRKDSYASQEHYEWAEPEVLESLPFPMDGKPSIAGLERLADEAKMLGDLTESYDFHESLRLDFVEGAFDDLRSRPALQAQLRETEAVVAKWGY